MNKRKLWSLVILCLLVFGCPISVFAGTFEETSSGWRYRKEVGMNTLEVLTLVLVIFAALTYIDNKHNRK